MRKLDSKVEEARALVETGYSVKKAAKKAGIWASTLRRRLENKGKAPGRPLTALTVEEENLIAGVLQERAEMGLGLTMVQLAALLRQTFLEIKAAEPHRTTGFEAGGQNPTYNFLKNFRIRNRISLRKTQEMKRGRQLLSLEEVRIWQAEIEKLKDSEDLREVFQDPQRIWNFDETSVKWGIDGQRVLVQKNTKGSIPAKSAGTRNSTTLGVTANANGDVLPPSIVFEGKRDLSGKYIAAAEKEGYDFGGQLPSISFTESGFVNTDTLLSLLRLLHQHCVELKIKLPVALFLDAAPQHLSLLVIQSAQQLGIRLLLVLPNATWLLQPLDLSFFLEFKREFQRKIWDEQIANEVEGKSLNRTTLLTLIDHSVKETKVKAGLVQRGWRMSGIFPWDKDAPKLSSLKPSGKFAQRKRARDKGLEDTLDTLEASRPLEEGDGKIASHGPGGMMPNGSSMEMNGMMMRGPGPGGMQGMQRGQPGMGPMMMPGMRHMMGPGHPGMHQGMGNRPPPPEYSMSSQVTFSSFFLQPHGLIEPSSGPVYALHDGPNGNGPWRSNAHAKWYGSWRSRGLHGSWGLYGTCRWHGTWRTWRSWTCQPWPRRKHGW